jgi:hypothetical protein
MKIKLLYDKNNRNNVALKTLLSFDFLNFTDKLHDADIVAVFYSRNLINTVEDLLKNTSKCKILIEMTNYDFNNNRVFMINNKIRDLCIANFKNNIFGLEPAHVDIQFTHKNLNLRAEVMNCLLVTGDIIGWKNYNEKLQLRFSYNNDSVHVSGYIREQNFTLSIFISNTGINFNETITVYTRYDGIFKLSNDYHEHTYEERYAASFQKLIGEVFSNDNYYQFYIPLVIKSCLGGSGSKKGSRGATAGVDSSGVINRNNYRGLLRNIKQLNRR